MIDECYGMNPMLMYKYVYDGYDGHENLYRLSLPYLMLCNLEYVKLCTIIDSYDIQCSPIAGHHMIMICYIGYY